MESTVFEKIVRGELPATKVFEDADMLAFMDIQPVAKGHLLLIPKAHFTWMLDVPDKLLNLLFIRAKKLMAAMKSSLGCDYVQLSIVGKDVPHFHIHLIPRFFKDDIHSASTTSYRDNEMQSYAERITSVLEK